MCHTFTMTESSLPSSKNEISSSPDKVEPSVNSATLKKRMFLLFVSLLSLFFVFSAGIWAEQMYPGAVIVFSQPSGNNTDVHDGVTSSQPQAVQSSAPEGVGVEIASAVPHVSVSPSNDLREGAAVGAADPEFEVFVFADFTEEGFSGRILTESIPRLLEGYPEARVWYIHTVLAYRTDEVSQLALKALICLDEQQQVWRNMRELVNQDGLVEGQFENVDLEAYTRCRDESSIDIESYVTLSGERMSKYQINAIPTVLVLPRGADKAGMIIGAVPWGVFEQQVNEVLAASR